MALVKIKKADELTPEEIQNRLFYFSNVFHKYHLDTTSYAEHKALGKLYESLIEFKDSICELLMGDMDGKRIGKLKLEDVPEYSKDNCEDLLDDLKEFSYQLYQWAESKKYCDIENRAQELSGKTATTIYLLTLK